MKIFKPTLTTSSLLFSFILFTACEKNNHEKASSWEGSTSDEITEEAAGDYDNNSYSWSSGGEKQVATGAVSMLATTADGNVSSGAASVPATAIGKAGNKAEVTKKIIKTADLRIQVEDLKSTTATINHLIDQHKAYSSRLNETKNSYSKDADITIRVPIANFDSLTSQILQLAQYVHRKEIRANDVTEEFVDIMSRLKTKKEVEKRYLEILKQAKTIEEILQVEAQLAGIREEIEAKEGRLKYLSDQVSFSTINLEVYQEVEYEAAPVLEAGFFDKTGKAIVSGWKGLLNFIVGIFYVWPVLLIGAGTFFILRRYFKRRRLKNKDI